MFIIPTIHKCFLKFTEANPDKGTKTIFIFTSVYAINKFTEANPDKGTKTLILAHKNIVIAKYMYSS